MGHFSIIIDLMGWMFCELCEFLCCPELEVCHCFYSSLCIVVVVGESPGKKPGSAQILCMAENNFYLTVWSMSFVSGHSDLTNACGHSN